MAGNFERLNDALFAQVDKLQSIDPCNTEQLEHCINQSMAVSKLAGNIISNATNEINLLRFMSSEGMCLNEVAAIAPKMITGGN